MIKPMKQVNIFGGVDLVLPDQPKPTATEATGNKYKDFGLDTTKVSQDKGKCERTYFDVWTRTEVQGSRYFSLCFSNWVATRSTLEAMSQQQPQPAIDGDMCIKCRAAHVPLHYSIEGYDFGQQGMDVGLCADCVAMGIHYLDKPVVTPAGTQFSLF